MKIYFAGSIRGGRNDAPVYQSLIAYLSSFGEVLTEHVGETSLFEKGNDGPNDRYIHDRDMAWLAACDLLVAEVSVPSLGVGYELGYAVALKKPVLCLYKSESGRPLSAMIAGSPGIRTAMYSSIDEAKTILAGLIIPMPYEEPGDPLRAREQAEKHLSSTGNTPFKVIKVRVSRRVGFLSISFLNSIKRQILEKLANIRIESYPRETAACNPNSVPYPEKRLDFRANVMNQYASLFYKRHGVEVLEPAFEVLSEIIGKEVMRTRYCVRYELDACPKFSRSRRRLKEPLRISGRRHTFLLKFDCGACRMSLIFLGKKQVG